MKKADKTLIKRKIKDKILCIFFKTPKKFSQKPSYRCIIMGLNSMGAKAHYLTIWVEVH